MTAIRQVLLKNRQSSTHVSGTARDNMEKLYKHKLSMCLVQTTKLARKKLFRDKRSCTCIAVQLFVIIPSIICVYEKNLYIFVVLIDNCFDTCHYLSIIEKVGHHEYMEKLPRKILLLH